MRRRSDHGPAPARTLRRDLRGTAVLLFLVLVFVGATTILALVETRATVEDLTGRLVPLSNANRSLLQSLTDAETGERGFLISGDDSFLAPFESGLDGFDRSSAELVALAGDDADLVGRIDHEVALGRTWIDDFAVPVVALRAEDPDAALAQARSGAGRVRFEPFRAANAEVQQELAADIADAQAAVDRAQRIALGVLGGVLLVAAGLAVSSSIRTYRNLMVPLEDLTDTVEQLGRRELTARAEVGGPAEIAAVAGAVNDMAEEIEQLTVEQRRRAGQERTIRDITGALFDEVTVDAVLGTAAHELAMALGVDRVVTRRVDAADAPVVAEWDDPEVGPAPPPELSGPLRDLLAERLLAERVLSFDAGRAAADEALEPVEAYVRGLGVQALAIAVIDSGDEAHLAVLHVVRGERRWGDADLAILAAVARAVGVALERARFITGQAQLIAELQQLDQAKDDFISSVSHELRTPLTSLIGYAEMLRDGDAGALNPVQDGMVSAVERNGRRLRDLIEDLLTLSRISTGTLSHTDAEVDLVAVLDDVRVVLEPTVPHDEVTLTWAADPGVPPVAGDRDQLERVVLNLVSNAVKFTLPGGSVVVSLAAEGDDVVLRVRDSGIGIPADEQDRLFTRFYRASTARQHAIGGTGLGLVIIQTIVENHHGTVELWSEVGVGTEMTVRLPAAPTPDRAAAVAEQAD